MHELSIAVRVVEAAVAHCRAAGADTVTGVTLHVGRLAAVHTEALEHAFAIAREATPLANATLEIVELPVRVWCDRCQREHPLAEVVPLACPACGHPTGDLRGGRELELVAVEVLTREAHDAP